jgi:hypothetical protein
MRAGKAEACALRRRFATFLSISSSDALNVSTDNRRPADTPASDCSLRRFKRSCGDTMRFGAFEIAPRVIC